MISVLGPRDQFDYLVDNGFVYLKDGSIWFEAPDGKAIETIMTNNYIDFWLSEGYIEEDVR